MRRLRFASVPFFRRFSFSRSEDGRGAHRRYRHILEGSREVIYETDPDGRWIYLSPAWKTLTGRDPASAIGRKLLDIVEPDDRAEVTKQLSALHRGDVTECTLELRIRHTDGDVRWASVLCRRIVDDSGNSIGKYGSIQDVTDRRLAEEARAEIEQHYRLLADHSSEMIVRLSLQGLRRYVSPASLDLLGYTPEELLNEAAAGAIHPDDRASAIAACISLLDGVEKPMSIYRQLRKDGAYVWLEASYRLVRDDDGAPTELVATVRGVNRRETVELERLTAKNQMSEANRLLLMAEEMSRVGHWRVDTASGTVFWSDVVCVIHGRARGDAPTLDDAIAFYHPDDRALVQAAVDDAMVSGKHFGFGARIIREDGEVRHVVSSGRAETAPDGSVIGLFGVVQDVTEAHDASAALETASRHLSDSNRLLTMAETIGQLGHWRIDYCTEQMLWSDEVYRIYGLPPDTEPTTQNALSVYHPDDIEAVRHAIARARETNSGYTSQARLVRPDGSTVHIVTRAEVEFDGSGTAVALFGIVQNVSERVAAQVEMQESEARLRLLTEQASDVISLHDVDGKCLFMSPSVETILGFTPIEMQQRSFRSLVVDEDQSIIARLNDELAASASGNVATERFRMRRKDGRCVWIEASARVAEYRGQSRIVVVSRDVTDQVRVEADLEAARDRAEVAAQAKSSFLANMSHEIRTPMNGVIGFTDLMLAGDLSEEQRRRAEMIADSGRAMMQLLNDVLDLSKVEAGQVLIAREPFDLRQTLGACMQLVSPALEKKGLEARCDFAADLPPMVLGDALRLRQIVLNLLGNAAKFTERGSVTLRASRSADRDDILIAIEDTGIGIAPDRQAAVFEQFVQAGSDTTSKFGGTGLGLTISAQLARLMNGGLRLESQPGYGTTFFVTIPLPATAVSSDTTPAEGVAIDGRFAHSADHRPLVLVAEDHDVNKLLIAEQLDELGYDCDIANDGAEAVAMIDAEGLGRRYTAVLMDVRMPGLDGIEATRRIRAAGFSVSTLPIIALTANAYADDVIACLNAGMQAHLTKPVSREELKKALRQWSALPAIDRGEGTVRPKMGIKTRYAARRQETLDAVGTLIGARDWSAAEVDEAIDLLHKLAGTAGMFGEAALGDCARHIELGLRSWSPDMRAASLPEAYEAMRRVAG